MSGVVLEPARAKKAMARWSGEASLGRSPLSQGLKDKR